MEYPDTLKTESHSIEEVRANGSDDPSLPLKDDVIKVEALSDAECPITGDCHEEEYLGSKHKPETVYLVVPKVEVEYSDDEDPQEVNHMKEDIADEYPATTTEGPYEEGSYDRQYQQFYQRDNMLQAHQGTSELQTGTFSQSLEASGPAKRIPGRMFKCDICAKVFQHFCHLRKHSQIHSERKFICEICSTRFAQSSNLKAHMLVHSKDRVYECPVCKKTFARSWNLKAHSVIHTGERKFSCTSCPLQFALRHNLLKHQLVHTKEKKYTCSICGSQYAHLSYLRIHLMGHEGQKKFFCSICDKGFLESYKLKLHAVVHTKEKNFNCSICETKFTQSTSLKRHLKKIHKIPNTTPSGRRSTQFLDTANYVHQTTPYMEQREASEGGNYEPVTRLCKTVSSEAERSSVIQQGETPSAREENINTVEPSSTLG